MFIINMAKDLFNILTGFVEWKDKIEEIKKLNLPLEDFYVHLKKEVNELDEGRNADEMCDAINTLFMVYTMGDYNVTFKDCYDKLKKREEKYEIKKCKP